MFSVALYPPPPVARWPELTLVAARGGCRRRSAPAATIKHPNDVLVDGRKAAGILAEAGDRVVLGIGINVGSAAWPGAGWVERDRLELLVDVLERLERGYDAGSAQPVTDGARCCRRRPAPRAVSCVTAPAYGNGERALRLASDDRVALIDEHGDRRRLAELNAASARVEQRQHRRRRVDRRAAAAAGRRRARR